MVIDGDETAFYVVCLAHGCHQVLEQKSCLCSGGRSGAMPSVTCSADSIRNQLRSGSERVVVGRAVPAGKGPSMASITSNRVISSGFRAKANPPPPPRVERRMPRFTRSWRISSRNRSGICPVGRQLPARNEHSVARFSQLKKCLQRIDHALGKLHKTAFIPSPEGQKNKKAPAARTSVRSRGCHSPVSLRGFPKRRIA